MVLNGQQSTKKQTAVMEEQTFILEIQQEKVWDWETSLRITITGAFEIALDR